MEQCQFCGGTLGAKVRFCSNCGKPVTANSKTNLVRQTYQHPSWFH